MPSCFAKLSFTFKKNKHIYIMLPSQGWSFHSSTSVNVGNQHLFIKSHKQDWQDMRAAIYEQTEIWMPSSCFTYFVYVYAGIRDRALRPHWFEKARRDAVTCSSTEFGYEGVHVSQLHSRPADCCGVSRCFKHI